MERDQEQKEQPMKLPTSVVTFADVAKLLRELESVESILLQLKVRGGGTETSLPHLTRRLESLLDVNKLNVLQADDRKRLMSFLNETKQNAPILHISFGSEPTNKFLENLMTWIRKELGPNILLTIGFQPAIGAGCMLRSTNKFFDMSLKQTFVDKRPLLLEQIIPPVQEQEAPVQ
ncbi:MAG: hypothetical protein ACHQT9_03415 [Candidatus Saccharimonadales bacterium]